MAHPSDPQPQRFRRQGALRRSGLHHTFSCAPPPPRPAWNVTRRRGQQAVAGWLPTPLCLRGHLLHASVPTGPRAPLATLPGQGPWPVSWSMANRSTVPPGHSQMREGWGVGGERDAGRGLRMPRRSRHRSPEKGGSDPTAASRLPTPGRRSSPPPQRPGSPRLSRSGAPRASRPAGVSPGQPRE